MLTAYEKLLRWGGWSYEKIRKNMPDSWTLHNLFSEQPPDGHHKQRPRHIPYLCKRGLYRESRAGTLCRKRVLAVQGFAGVPYSMVCKLSYSFHLHVFAYKGGDKMRHCKYCKKLFNNITKGGKVCPGCKIKNQMKKSNPWGYL